MFEQVRSIASDLFDLPPDRITVASSPETVENWDSVQHLNLVLALEEKFHIQLSPEEIQEMRSVGEIAKLVGAKLSTPAE